MGILQASALVHAYIVRLSPSVTEKTSDPHHNRGVFGATMKQRWYVQFRGIPSVIDCMNHKILPLLTKFFRTNFPVLTNATKRSLLLHLFTAYRSPSRTTVLRSIPASTHHHEALLAKGQKVWAWSALLVNKGSRDADYCTLFAHPLPHSWDHLLLAGATCLHMPTNIVTVNGKQRRHDKTRVDDHFMSFSGGVMRKRCIRNSIFLLTKGTEAVLVVGKADV